MCGIVGIVGHDWVNHRLYDALTVLQHRGQDAAGIATADAGRIFLRKSVGLVRDVFRKDHMLRLRGHLGIGHVRYPTAGQTVSAESQPFYVSSPHGIVLSHNGNLTNSETLREELYRDELRHINTGSDSEVLLNVLAHELSRGAASGPTPEDVFAAVERLHLRCRGAYSVVALVNDYGLLAFRDPRGIRPLVFGQRTSAGGLESMVASESVALDVVGFDRVRDVRPGEALWITPDGEVHSKICTKTPELTPCIFEYVYLARPDSIIDGVSVYQTRLNMGSALAEQVRTAYPKHEIDVVIPIPDTSRTAALRLATSLEVPFREGFIKNRYIGRTFIMPGQAERVRSVRHKLNPIRAEFYGKNVLLVDDSIVRGTTCEQIIQMARDAGALKVYFASCAPAVRYPNVYGIDMPAACELIASDRTTDEVREVIGADGLIYQRLDALIDAVRSAGSEASGFDTSIFDGEYITGDVTPAYLDALESARGEASHTDGRNRPGAQCFDLTVEDGE